MMPRTARFIRTAGLAVVALSFVLPTSSLLAQDRPDTPPTTPPSRERPGRGDGVTNGPRVPAEGIKGNERFGGDGKGRVNRPAATPPAGVWFTTLDQLGLSAEQKAAIDPMIAAFKKSEEDFRTEFGPKIKELEAKRKAEAKDGGRATPETVKELQELLAKRPKPEETQKAIFAKLSAEQQKTMTEKLEAAQNRARDRRDGADQRRKDGGDAPRREGAPKRERPSSGGTGGGTGSGGKPTA